jgi:hypothetical protein
VHDGVVAIVLTGEELRQLQLGQHPLHLGDAGLDLL